MLYKCVVIITRVTNEWQVTSFKRRRDVRSSVMSDVVMYKTRDAFLFIEIQKGC